MQTNLFTSIFGISFNLLINTNQTNHWKDQLKAKNSRFYVLIVTKEIFRCTLTEIDFVCYFYTYRPPDYPDVFPSKFS